MTHAYFCQTLVLIRMRHKILRVQVAQLVLTLSGVKDIVSCMFMFATIQGAQQGLSHRFVFFRSAPRNRKSLT